MIENKQQTAVDILCEKLAMKLGIPQAITFYIDHQEEIREAKKIEREKIEKAYDDAIMKGRQEDGEQYYNETYEGNK
jgi:hypothetical protein